MPANVNGHTNIKQAMSTQSIHEFQIILFSVMKLDTPTTVIKMAAIA